MTRGFYQLIKRVNHVQLVTSAKTAIQIIEGVNLHMFPKIGEALYPVLWLKGESIKGKS